MKISFITTVFNEEKTIGKFLDSLFAQTKLPDEVVIVDGGSTDATVERLKTYDLRLKKNVNVKILVKKGNRSVGRNEAIRRASGDIIVCSDSGCMLDKDWIKNIIKPFKDPPSRKATGGHSKRWIENISKPFEDKSVDVVAGYYKGKATNIFQKCLIPYVLVMPDKVDPDKFLPATRSVAFKKFIWNKVGGFDEKLSHNEDYVFANRLKKLGAKIVFAKDAIVYWLPRNTYKEAFIMFFRFALGDAESGMWRPTVLLVFVRYFLVLFIMPNFIFLLVAFILYTLWSIGKNYKYINDKRAIIILPLIQFTADAAVLSGSIIGWLRRIK